MHSILHHAVTDQVKSLPHAPSASEIEQAVQLKLFLADIGVTIAAHLTDYRLALGQIATDKEQGTVRTPSGALYPVHQEARRNRTQAQQALRVLVPAQRIARRQYQHLLFQPAHSNMPALEEHLLSHAYRIPRELLFYQDRTMTQAARFTQLTLTAGQATIALELLARYPLLFPWGPRFAESYVR
jgi:hypothetical protein